MKKFLEKTFPWLILLGYCLILALFKPHLPFRIDFYSLALGNFIIKNGFIPHVDPFSWSQALVEWSPVNWLGPVLQSWFVTLCLQHTAWDLSLAVLSYRFVLLVLGAVGMLRLARSYDLDRCSENITLAVYLLGASYVLVDDSIIWSYTLLPCLLYFIKNIRSGSLMRIAALCVFWFSVDQWYVIWPLCLAILLTGSVFTRSYRQGMIYAFLLLLSLSVLLLQTDAMTEFSAIGSLSDGDILLKKLIGILPPNFHQLPLLGVVIVGVVGAGLFLRNKLPGELVALSVAGLSGVFFSINLQAIFVVAGAIVVGKVSQQVFNFNPETKFKFPINLLKVVMLVFLVVQTSSAILTSSASGNGLEELLPKLKQAKIEIENSTDDFRLFNDLGLSGRLSYLGIPVFVDQRGTFFSKKGIETTVTGSVLKDYQKLILVDSSWEQILESWKFNLALLYADSRLTNLLLEVKGWRVVGRSVEEFKLVNGEEVSRELLLLQK